MLKTSLKGMLLATMGAALVLSSGCAFTSYGPSLGILSVPIPVSPYFQNKKEDEAAEARYASMMVLDPIPPGKTHIAEDPPSDDQILRKFQEIHNVRGNFPALYEVQHNNIRIVKEKIVDTVDPVRVYPLVGPAQLHHSHWICKVYYTEIVRNGWPIPHTIKNEERMEVIKIDQDHLHRAGNVVPGDAN
ncbi:MAG: hypothetical protein Q4D98_03310 [Planctomycetia bacterium]|nr:hypothetical protein [Planctomycetia bacterium]